MSSLTRVNSQPPPESALRHILESCVSEPLPQWDSVAAALQVRHCVPGSTVFLQDVANPYVYAVRSGLLKLSYVSEDGEEWIKSFIHESGFFASIAALEPGGRTSFMATALEPCTLEQVDYRVLAGLATTSLPWSHALRVLTLRFAARKEQRERELLTLRPELRYIAFQSANPGLAQRVAQKDLARYLGLTPVGLNRIAMRVRRAVTDTH